MVLCLVFGRLAYSSLFCLRASSFLIAYAPLFGFRAVSLCLNTLSPGWYLFILDQMSGQIPYAPIFRPAFIQLRIAPLCLAPWRLVFVSLSTCARDIILDQVSGRLTDAAIFSPDR